MSYEQQHATGSERMLSQPPRNAHESSRRYYATHPSDNEPTLDPRGYRSHTYEPMQQGQQYGYANDQGYPGGAASRWSGKDAVALNEQTEGLGSPAVQHEAENYNLIEQQRPLDQSQTASFGPQVSEAPYDRGARLAGKSKGGSKEYLPHHTRAPKQYQRARPPNSGSMSQLHNDLQRYNSYERAEDGNEPWYHTPDERSLNHNDLQPQTHTQGRSERYRHGGDRRRDGLPRSNGWHSTQVHRPSYDRDALNSDPRQNLDKRKIFDEPISPETVSWDNPFPVFPAVKNKGMHNGGRPDGSVMNSFTREDTRELPNSRPRTADGKVGQRRDQAQSPVHDHRPGPQNPQEGFHRVGQIAPTSQAYAADERQGTHTGFSRPHPSTGRHSEEAPRRALVRSNETYDIDAGRSKTMPSTLSSAVMRDVQNGRHDSFTWQEPGPNAGYHGPNGKAYLPDEASIISGSRPPGPTRSRSDEISGLRDSPTSNLQNIRAYPQARGQDSIADVYDSYYDATTPRPINQVYNDEYLHQPPIPEKMPNFDAAQTSSTPYHHRGMTIDDHLQLRSRAPEVPPIPTQYRQKQSETVDSGQSHGRVPRSRSQPDLLPQNQPSNKSGFDQPGSSGKPSTSHAQHDARAQSQGPYRGPLHRPNYAHQQGSLENDLHKHSKPHNANGRSHLQQPPEQRLPGLNRQPAPWGSSPPEQNRIATDKTGTDSRMRSASPPSSFHMNPDTLPAHPAPVRAGLSSGRSPMQTPKPAPVRNYNGNGSPLQALDPTQLPKASRSEGRNETVPVTQQELDRLRQAVKTNPSDQKIQVNLARKLVEAANALDNDVPRMDQRTIQKTRERYFAESNKIAKRLVSIGNADGMFFLGDCYSQGLLGLEKDPKEAFVLYQSAAKIGHPQAAFRVAVCCELGLELDGGTKRDLGKAVQWYKRAAQLGDTPAMYKTGVIQLKGLLGQSKDSGEAILWLRRAAEKADKDNPHALHELVSVTLLRCTR